MDSNPFGDDNISEYADNIDNSSNYIAPSIDIENDDGYGAVELPADQEEDVSNNQDTTLMINDNIIQSDNPNITIGSDHYINENYSNLSDQERRLKEREMEIKRREEALKKEKVI